MRMRSPRMAPWVKGLEGSTAMMPTSWPRLRSSAARAPVRLLLPEPALPVTPIVWARPERG